ncbi:MAG TPA: DUF983 domain-containing protein [Ohtaekwangia sp.]|nr:DUF983 domain-containing protein [Ohtaekwangia sp.]
MRERTSLEALVKGKCPRCRQGDIFQYSAANLRRFSIMHNECPHCGVRLEPEPGFYQGAMYVSYGFTVGILTILAVLFYQFTDMSEWLMIGIIIGVLFLLAPLNYRYSRIVYLYLFGGLRQKRKPEA